MTAVPSGLKAKDYMKACIQRVRRAKVTVEGEICGEIGLGMLVLLGVGNQDTAADARFFAEKIAGLRIFDDPAEKMNLSLRDVGGAMLVVSQFTLYGDVGKGARPSFDDSAPAEKARTLYDEFVAVLTALLPGRVQTGEFQASMQVSLVNDGPVTILVEKSAP
jgi:D-tyrosyl-tRNA(Tyr) deacylase